jgi:hypothetical protein
MFADTQMMGIDAAFPDVCKTPSPAGPVPIPYPNVAAGPMGVPAAYNVLIMCAPAHNLSTTIPMTNGDNAGVALGMVSPTVMGPARRVNAAYTCLVMCAPVTRLGCFTSQNGNNAKGARVAPSQTKVLVLAP